MVNGTDEWVQLGDTIEGEQAYENSGNSVALSEDWHTVAVGAPGYTNSNNDTFAGATRVYTMVNGTDEWVQLGDTIEGEQADERSGYSVALSNDGRTMAVGAIGYTNSNNAAFAGATRVYTMVNGTYEWVQLGDTIEGEQAYENSGYSVALSEDGHTVAAGAPYSTNSNNDTFAGATRVYTIVNGTGEWVQLGDTIEGEQAGEFFGYSVALSEDWHTVAVGAPYSTNSNNDTLAGATRVYTMVNGTDEW